MGRMARPVPLLVFSRLVDRRDLAARGRAWQNGLSRATLALAGRVAWTYRYDGSEVSSRPGGDTITTPQDRRALGNLVEELPTYSSTIGPR